MLETLSLLKETDFPKITRRQLDTVQVNLGYRCNQQCIHCHVAAGPNRNETMDRETAEAVIAFAIASDASTLDITGGAPELNAPFRDMVVQARRAGLHVIDRCNLTILVEPGYEDLVSFLSENDVEVIASLPCYAQENVDAQRGKGVFERSIQGLGRLNEEGYGTDPRKPLNLVYNPQGPTLPPPQPTLEADYRRTLFEQYGIRFTNLFTVTNMPIRRFGSTLRSRGQFGGYMALLRDAYRAANLDQVMCRNLISVDWQGRVYDCDFNQMLGLPLVRRTGEGEGPVHVSELFELPLNSREITVGEHCYGCTAGQGSSCGGALN